jgi:DNA polymerase V
MSTTLHQDSVRQFATGSQLINIPMFGHNVPAGFPSPADDHIQGRLSLDEHLIQHKEATFFVRAKGSSMVGAGIFDGDLLVVDKSLEPSSGNIVIAIIDGELTVKRLIQHNGSVILKPENPRFKAIELKDGQELQVWGVVTSTIKKFV